MAKVKVTERRELELVVEDISLQQVMTDLTAFLVAHPNLEGVADIRIVRHDDLRYQAKAHIGTINDITGG